MGKLIDHGGLISLILDCISFCFLHLILVDCRCISQLKLAVIVAHSKQELQSRVPKTQNLRTKLN